MDPTRELLQLRDRIGQSRGDAGQLALKVAPVGRDIGLRGAHCQSERDQSPLGAVVEVSLDPAARLVRRGDDPPARGGKLGAAVRIGDRGCDQLGELLQAFLGIERHRRLGRDTQRAVLGGLVVAVVINAMSDLIQGANSAGYEWVVTGVVLLLAAGFDAVVRRARAG